MNLHFGWKLALLTLVIGASVFALEAKTPLYITARNTHLKKSSDPTAPAVGAPLQPGDKVTYEAPDFRPRWKKVTTASGDVGVVHQACLSLTPPSQEVVSGISSGPTEQSFASSGAAAKGLDDLAKSYGEHKKWTNEVDQVKALEDLAKGVTEDDVLMRAKQVGLVDTGDVSAKKGKSK